MTPHDRYQRRIDLAGEIKQADELVNECRNDVEAKRKALELAEQALTRQLGLRADKLDEARRLAKEAHDDFMSLVPDDGTDGGGSGGSGGSAIPAVISAIEAQSVEQSGLPDQFPLNGLMGRYGGTNEANDFGQVRLNAVFDEATHHP